MKRISFYTLFFIVFVFLFLGCQTVSEQLGNAKLSFLPGTSANAAPLASPLALPDNAYSNVVIPTTDTNSPEAREIIRRLDSFYKLQVARGFSGSVLVGYGGQIMYRRHFGFANKGLNVPMQRNSSNQLASTSKPFTATAILWLHQHKYLNIEDKVKKYLKDFPYEDITITMLLNHRSGLQDYVRMGTRYWPSGKIMYNEDLLQVFNKFKPALLSKPNTRFYYSNTNYALLARIVEEVSALPFKDFMKQFIFEPLGMKNTFVYDPADAHPHHMAMNYKGNWIPEPDTYADGVTGDKGIYSTVEDMYRWDQSFYSHALLSPKTLQMAYAPYSFERAGVKNYGLGWRMMQYPNGYKVIFHNGWWHGNNTVFYRFIKDNFTIIVLGNKFSQKIYTHARSIYDIVRGSSMDGDLQWEASGSPQEE